MITNPIDWAIGKVQDMIWHWQFKRAPTKILGTLLVKEFRGNLYCVGTVESIAVKPHDAVCGPQCKGSHS